MIYPNKPLYLLSLLGYIYYLTYYTLTTKDNIVFSLVISSLLNYLTNGILVILPLFLHMQNGLSLLVNNKENPIILQAIYYDFHPNTTVFDFQ